MIFFFPSEKHNDEINTVLDNLPVQNRITKGLHKKLKVNNPRTAELYLLPKIHKGITPPPPPPPGRPIVSANGCPTEKISALVVIILQPYLKQAKSCLKDTVHFLNKLNEITTLPEGYLLGTLDVTSLYTNIPNQEGCLSIYRLLSRLRTPSRTELTNTNICQLLWYVLTKNNFDFNGKHYLQVGGTAMGTRVAPTYANLFLADFEENHVYTYSKQPLVWLRFIDDTIFFTIFFIWPHGQEELNLFKDHLNNVHTTIKFTVETSSSSVNFLDTVVTINNDRTIKTSLYVKPTDSAGYLHYRSAHPKHCIRGIPYGQFLRIQRICTDFTDFVDHCVIKG